jgi:L-threonylcarbamoyladenylate synthase
MCGRRWAARIPLIVDGGACQVGIESTVIDVSAQRPRVLRPGMIHVESLVAVVGELETDQSLAAGALRSPGLQERHYAPKARLLVLSWRNEAHLANQLAARHVPFAATFILAHSIIPSGDRFGAVSVIPHDPEAFGRALYAEWHRCDEDGAVHIVVEAVPPTSRWAAIADRLRRASA